MEKDTENISMTVYQELGSFFQEDHLIGTKFISVLLKSWDIHAAKVDTKFIITIPLHKKWSFSLSMPSVNVTKRAISNGFGHILKKSIMENFIFCAVLLMKLKNRISDRSKILIVLLYKTWYRSNHRRYSVKKSVLKNFAKYIRKTSLPSLFFVFM